MYRQIRRKYAVCISAEHCTDTPDLLTLNMNFFVLDCNIMRFESLILICELVQNRLAEINTSPTGIIA